MTVNIRCFTKLFFLIIDKVNVLLISKEIVMKKAFLVLCIGYAMMLFANQHGEYNYFWQSTINCEKYVRFGDISICLPKIPGMNECYSHPKVKREADRTEYPGNSVLAFYHNDYHYKNLDIFDVVNSYDYIKLYVTNSLANKNVTKSDLNQLSEIIKGNYIETNFNTIKSKLEEKKGTVNIERAYLIDHYSPNEDVKSFVIILTMGSGSDKEIVIGVANALRIKSRLLFMAYYNKFTGEESINQAKRKNDNVVQRIMSVN